MLWVWSIEAPTLKDDTAIGAEAAMAEVPAAAPLGSIAGKPTVYPRRRIRCWC